MRELRSCGFAAGFACSDGQTDTGLLSVTGAVREGEKSFPKSENYLKEKSEMSHWVLSYEI